MPSNDWALNIFMDSKAKKVPDHPSYYQIEHYELRYEESPDSPPIWEVTGAPEQIQLQPLSISAGNDTLWIYLVDVYNELRENTAFTISFKPSPLTAEVQISRGSAWRWFPGLGPDKNNTHIYWSFKLDRTNLVQGKTISNIEYSIDVEGLHKFYLDPQMDIKP